MFGCNSKAVIVEKNICIRVDATRHNENIKMQLKMKPTGRERTAAARRGNCGRLRQIPGSRLRTVSLRQRSGSCPVLFHSPGCTLNFNYLLSQLVR